MKTWRNLSSHHWSHCLIGFKIQTPDRQCDQEWLDRFLHAVVSQWVPWHSTLEKGKKYLIKVCSFIEFSTCLSIISGNASLNFLTQKIFIQLFWNLVRISIVFNVETHKKYGNKKLFQKPGDSELIIIQCRNQNSSLIIPKIFLVQCRLTMKMLSSYSGGPDVIWRSSRILADDVISPMPTAKVAIPEECSVSAARVTYLILPFWKFPFWTQLSSFHIIFSNVAIIHPGKNSAVFITYNSNWLLKKKTLEYTVL